MPLDDFQKRIARIIAVNRTERSPFAGGSMIQRHGFRISDDGDIFSRDEDVNALYEADLLCLEAEGLHVHLSKRFSGFIEAIVSSLDETNPATSKLQWVAEGLNGFFTPIPDEEVGYRLHFADLSVNKLLACAGRKEVRDFVDLWMIDRLSLPLWRIAVAAPGKDIRWSPHSIIEKISANMVFSRDDFESDLVLTMEIDPRQVLLELTASIDEARGILVDQEPETFGKLAVWNEAVLNSRLPAVADEWLLPAKGGGRNHALFPDDNLVSLIIDLFGRDGREISDSLTFP